VKEFTAARDKFAMGGHRVNLPQRHGGTEVLFFKKTR
jgi:hypothetical protein